MWVRTNVRNGHTQSLPRQLSGISRQTAEIHVSFASLLSLSLGSDLGLCSLDLFLGGKIVVFDGFHVIIQFIHQGDTWNNGVAPHSAAVRYLYLGQAAKFFRKLYTTASKSCIPTGAQTLFILTTHSFNQVLTYIFLTISLQKIYSLQHLQNHPPLTKSIFLYIIFLE